ncbi:AAA family ATPase, partial [Pseudomonas aeruginosa]
KSPTRSHQFQQLIENVQYVVAEIVGSAPFVIVAGISDYYAFTAASTTCLITINFTIVPGFGSSSSANLISLLKGRAEKFIVL